MEHLLLHAGMICTEWLCYYLQEYTQSTPPMIHLMGSRVWEGGKSK